jgi:hypothetical protein
VTTVTKAPTSTSGSSGTWDSTVYTTVADYPDTTTYLTHGTTAGYIEFLFSAFALPSNATGITVYVDYYDYSTASQANNLAGRLYVNGTAYSATSHQPANGAWTQRTDTWATNPNTSAAWTYTAVNTLLTRFGVTSTDANPQLRLSSIQLRVTYSIGVAIAGTLTTSGNLVKRTGKALAGALTSSGILVKLVGKKLTGVLSTSGTIVAAKVKILAVAGTLASSGTLVKRVGKALAGALTTSAAFARTGTYVIAQDTLTRANQTYWGTSSDSNVWGSDAASNAAFSILSNKGHIATSGSTLNGTLGASGQTDVEVLIKFQGTALTGTDNFGAVVRWADTNNWYKAYIGGGSGFIVQKKVGGTATVLASTAFSPANNTDYYIRFRVVGTTLTANAWLASGSEPGGWMLTVTDAALSSGYVGVRAQVSTSGASADLSSFYAVTIASGTLYYTTPSGALTTAGALVKQVRKPLAGALTSAGALVKATGKKIAGTLGTSGAISAVKTKLLNLTGTLSSSGALVKRAGKLFAGVLASVGQLILLPPRTWDFEDGTVQGWNYTGTITAIANSTAIAYTGTHSLALTATGVQNSAAGYARITAPSDLSVGSVVTAHVYVVGSGVTAQLYIQDQAYAQTAQTPVGLTSGAWTTLTWTIPSKPLPLRLIGVEFGGSSSFTGTIYLDTISYTLGITLLTLAGTLSTSGSLVKGVGKQLTGTLANSGTLVKQIGKLLSGTLTWGGRSYGIIYPDTLVKMQACKAAGCTHVVVQVTWAWFQANPGDTFWGPNVTAMNDIIGYASSVGLKVILSMGHQYIPDGFWTGLPKFKDQGGSEYLPASGTGLRVGDYVWSQTARTTLSAYYTTLISFLSPASIAAISAIRLGGGYYNELHYPPNGGNGSDVNTVHYWGYSAAAQAGTDLATGMSVCPYPGYTPYSGTPSQDAPWVTWYLSSLALYAKWQVDVLRAAGWAKELLMLHPGFGLRSNWTGSEYAYRVELAEGDDWGRQMDAYLSDPLVYPYSTWVDAVHAYPPDPWGVDSNTAAWGKLYLLALARGLNTHLMGENTGGQTTSDLDRVFGAGGSIGGDYYHGYIHLDYDSLYAGGSNVTMAQFAADIAADRVRTPLGKLVKQVGKSLAGVLASGGVHNRLLTLHRSYTGTLASAGVLVKQIGKKLAGTLTTSGAITAVKTKLLALAGSLATSGTFVKSVGKKVAGTLGMSGTLGRLLTLVRSYAGTLTTAGVLVKQVGKSFAGALATAGTFTKGRFVSLTGALTSSGILVKQTRKLLAGALASAGALTRGRFVGLTGVLSTSGVLVKQIGKVLAGTLTTAGVLLKGVGKLLAGALTTSGVLARGRFSALTGTLTTSGVLVKRMGKVLSGTLTTAGTLAKGRFSVLTGALTSSGALVKQVGKSLAGTLSTSGALVKATGKKIAGTLTNNGILVKQVGKGLAGTLTSAGTLTRGRFVFLTGALTSSGVLVKQVGKKVAGTLASAGVLVKGRFIGLTGALTSSGVLVKRVGKSFAGALTTAGVLTKGRFVALAGSLSTSGSLVKQIGKVLSGVLSTAGAIATQFFAGLRSFSVAGTLNTSGVLVKRTTKLLSGTLSTSGAIGRLLTLYRSYAGTLTSGGTLAAIKAKLISLAGALATSGVLVKRTTKLLSGTLTSSGTITRTLTLFRAYAGTLTSSGAIASIKTKLVAFAGTLASSGVLVKSVGKQLAGSLTSSGILVKRTTKLLAGALSTSGGLVKSVGKKLTGALSTAGTLTRTIALARVFAGALTSSGTLVKSVGKKLAGALTSGGAIATLKTRFIALVGALSSSGVLVKRVGKSFIGALSPTGSLARRISMGRSYAGTLAPTGSLVKRVSKKLTGTLGSIGSFAGIRFSSFYTAIVALFDRSIATVTLTDSAVTVIEMIDLPTIAIPLTDSTVTIITAIDAPQAEIVLVDDLATTT